MPDSIAWPKKERELHNHHFDSTIWNDLQFRDDDIVIATYAKSGTTWLQQIVSQLIFNGEEGLEVAEMSPWVDVRVPPKEVKLPMIEAQTHRRFLKTHLPVDALVYSPKAKYIYIGRDGRDVVWSFYNHHASANQDWYDALNNTPGRVGPPIEPPPGDVEPVLSSTGLNVTVYPFLVLLGERAFLVGDPRICRICCCCTSRTSRPICLAKFVKIAAFLEIPIDESKWDAILEHCSFEYMKANAAKSVPLGGVRSGKAARRRSFTRAPTAAGGTR